MTNKDFEPVIKAELAGREYTPKNGKGYILSADKTYKVLYYPLDMKFEVIDVGINQVADDLLGEDK